VADAREDSSSAGTVQQHGQHVCLESLSLRCHVSCPEEGLVLQQVGQLDVEGPVELTEERPGAVEHGAQFTVGHPPGVSLGFLDHCRRRLL